MNSMNNTVTGLASSLLLSVGLTSVAEKLDPTKTQAQNLGRVAMMTSAEFCVEICAFTPEAGQ